jgi:hypothetical protein
MNDLTWINSHAENGNYPLKSMKIISSYYVFGNKQ